MTRPTIISTFTTAGLGRKQQPSLSPSFQNWIMMFYMRGLIRHKFQILRAIVEGVAIYVMDNFFSGELAPNFLFHNNSGSRHNTTTMRYIVAAKLRIERPDRSFVGRFFITTRCVPSFRHEFTKPMLGQSIA